MPRPVWRPDAGPATVPPFLRWKRLAAWVLLWVLPALHVVEVTTMPCPYHPEDRRTAAKVALALLALPVLRHEEVVMVEAKTEDNAGAIVEAVATVEIENVVDAAIAEKTKTTKAGMDEVETVGAAATTTTTKIIEVVAVAARVANVVAAVAVVVEEVAVRVAMPEKVEVAVAVSVVAGAAGVTVKASVPRAGHGAKVPSDVLVREDEDLRPAPSATTIITKMMQMTMPVSLRHEPDNRVDENHPVQNCLLPRTISISAENLKRLNPGYRHPRALWLDRNPPPSVAAMRR